MLILSLESIQTLSNSSLQAKVFTVGLAFLLCLSHVNLHSIGFSFSFDADCQSLHALMRRIESIEFSSNFLKAL
jgi:hypothetical protein